ncbi:MAG: aldehyde dehydrogenase [Candidatus Marinimicrobia bacterium]|nr:aldehyde dehydrogenase [Candidatus Neomarinimicrobiota bacterium]
MKMPKFIPNWVDGKECETIESTSFEKINPADGLVLFSVARSQKADIDIAVESAKNSQSDWASIPPVKRGLMLHDIVMRMMGRKNEIAEVVHQETGKSIKDALGETEGAIECGLFYASEGQRLYGRTTTSGTPNKYASTIRHPIGVAGLIIAANTPIANVAWKVFPALICGNSSVLKVAEDTPATAWIFGEIVHEAGLPPGVLNIVQGYGDEAGAPLVEHPDVGVISFTGSTEIGRQIQRKAGQRLAKVSLELGGKNPLVVCDDADLDNAAKWVLLSAFSNAGQRCASASRIVVFESIYDEFVELLMDRTRTLTVGVGDGDDLGPVINEKQLNNMLEAIEKATNDGAHILIGGRRLTGEKHENGFYLEPTLIDNADAHAAISQCELFGPIACLYKVGRYTDALEMANDSQYGLTASIHTKDFNRANHFIQHAQAGAVIVNAGTYGSEPHMPFGGLKQSGNGTREPGTEALDVYSELKDVYINVASSVY